MCDEEFRFGAAHDQIRTFYWFPFVRDWSAHSTRTVRLSVDDVAPSFVSAKLEGAKLTVTMSESLDENFVPPKNHFELKVDEVLKPLAATNPVSVSGNTFTLTLASAPAASATVTVSLIIGSGGSGLRDLAWNPVRTAELDERPVTHYNVPVFQSAELAADGATLTLTFDEALDSSSVPAPGAFTVTGGGAVKRVSSVSVSGSSVRLALASDPPGSTVTVSYAAPAANPLRDTARKNAASFSDEAVTVRRTGPADQLVGNLAQPRVFTQKFVRSLATSFTTGSNAGGYAIAGVDVATADGNAFDASLCATLGSGRPSDQCVTLVRPAGFHDGSGTRPLHRAGGHRALARDPVRPGGLAPGGAQQTQHKTNVFPSSRRGKSAGLVLPRGRALGRPRDRELELGRGGAVAHAPDVRGARRAGPGPGAERAGHERQAGHRRGGHGRPVDVGRDGASDHRFRRGGDGGDHGRDAVGDAPARGKRRAKRHLRERERYGRARVRIHPRGRRRHAHRDGGHREQPRAQRRDHPEQRRGGRRARPRGREPGRREHGGHRALRGASREPRRGEQLYLRASFQRRAARAELPPRAGLDDA